MRGIPLLKVFSNSSYNGSSSLGGTLNNGLVAYYPFNGNASDESGNGNNGIVNGASLTTDRFGNIDAAYGFNNSYIQASASQLPTDERTVSVWFFSNDIGSGNLGRSLLGYGSGNTGPPNYTGAWSMTLDNIGSAFGQNSYEVNGHYNIYSITSSYGAAHPNGLWHHWVVRNSIFLGRTNRFRHHLFYFKHFCIRF